jgi:hypothetical protein
MNNRIIHFYNLGHLVLKRVGLQITIPQINTNHYSVPRMIVFKIQKSQLTRIQVVAQKPFYLQIDDRASIKNRLQFAVK